MLASVGTAGRVIRTHGDYHLGQTMLADRGWVILDFEGEPARPMSQRRLKRSPLRDVAGMLRSFSYAKWSVRARAEIKDPAVLDRWEADVRRAFVTAYAAATMDSGLYASFEDVAGLLRLFEIEKVLYELRYEINNRPNWVHVPLAGLLGMLGGQK